MSRVNGRAPQPMLPGPQMHCFLTNVGAARLTAEEVRAIYGVGLANDSLALELTAGKLSINAILPIAAAGPFGQSILQLASGLVIPDAADIAATQEPQG